MTINHNDPVHVTMYIILNIAITNHTSCHGITQILIEFNLQNIIKKIPQY